MQLPHKFCACFLFPRILTDFILFPAPLWLYLSGAYFIFSLGSILFTQWPLKNLFFVHRDLKMLPTFKCTIYIFFGPCNQSGKKGCSMVPMLPEGNRQNHSWIWSIGVFKKSKGWIQNQPPSFSYYMACQESPQKISALQTNQNNLRRLPLFSIGDGKEKQLHIYRVIISQPLCKN